MRRRRGPNNAQAPGLQFRRRGILIRTMQNAVQEELADYRRMERICLEQAERSVLPESRRTMLIMAERYRTAANKLEQDAVYLTPYASQRGILGSRTRLGRCISYIKSLLDRSPAITWPSSPAWCSSRCVRCWRCFRR